MGKRVKEAFEKIRSHSSTIFPWLGGMKLRKTCPDTDRDHRKKWRQFAHSNHYPMSICFARAAEKELTDTELLGMMAHEVGHLVAIDLKLPAHMSEERSPDTGKTPQAVQDEADWVVRNLLGIPIHYNARTLQELTT